MNFFDTYYDELCELIYQISADKNGWVNFSKKLLEIFDASYVHIQAIDFFYNVLSYSNGVGPLSSDQYVTAELAYLRYPIEADPRWGKFLDPERKGWYQCHTHVSEEFVKNSDLYQHILLPIDLRYVATHELIWDEKLCVFWSISTSQHRQPLNQQELDFLNRLMPHLKRVIQLKRHLYEFSVENIVGYNLINHLKQPIILLNLSGQIVHLNQTAEEFLKQYDVFKVIENKLVLPLDYQSEFSKNLYKIEEKFRSQQEHSLMLRQIDCKAQQLTLSMTLLASEKEKSFFGIRPLLMLTFEQYSIVDAKNKPQYKYQLSYAELQKKYLLTKRELELCDLFVNGRNLKQIEQEMQLTRSSIRTYLRNIFIKVQCNSQAELLRLLINSSIKNYQK